MVQDVIQNYIQSISKKFSYEETSEMGYRTDFENLLKEIFESINVRRFDHDAKSVEGNKPDFVVRKNDIPILYIEAKDIGISLDKVEKSDQMSRYFGYANLVLTDYVEFRFYRNGIRYEEPIKIAEIDKHSRTLAPIEKNYEHLAKTLLDFTESYKEPIRSGKHLAKIMGGKAQRIRDIVCSLYEENSLKDKDLSELYEAIKTMLIHDLTIKTFADMYAQTMVYGLFVARYYDNNLDNFTRQKARELIPNSNQFLKRFFDHIVGIDFKNNLKFVVDELCEVYSHADIGKLMGDYFKTSRGSSENYDPVIHFYEDFLKEYDPALRKKMGAFYTPQPVVDFIIKSVDLILKKEFGLINGVADTSKLTDGKHKVQILDPATGTGTFISTIIREIYIHFRLNGQEGRWPAYVHNDLLPRIHGFELMMAPYTIAHLRLGIAFKKTGFWDFHRRLGIYLTNSLENSDTNQLSIAFGLAESIAEESKQASIIKNNTPIMVVVGNPPYNKSSSNKGKWIQDLVQVYKEGLNEQNINSLSDDYVKFIRFSENLVEKNKTGIVAMITNNSFLDGVTHRHMRKHLLETFDDVYILNLHGNSKKKEKALDGGKDENIFDIQQGVSISLFIRKNINKAELGTVYYSEIYGKREEKFKLLNENNVQKINWKKINYSQPYYFFEPKDFRQKEEYNKGFNLKELFNIQGSGIKFRKDNLLVKNHFSKESVKEMLTDVENLPNLSLLHKYDFKETDDWKIDQKRYLFKFPKDEDIHRVAYKPFDFRWTYYPIHQINQIIPRGDSRVSLMKNFIKPNVGFCLMRGLVNSKVFNTILLTKDLMELNFYGFQTYVFPLYKYLEDGSKISNFNIEITNKIKNIVGETESEELMNYIYAVLYSKTYREKFVDFLKIDFPRIPYPKDAQNFKKLIELGQELRGLHLMESPLLDNFITTYPVGGSNTVEKITYTDNKLFINKDQYFGNISQSVWDFYIGGYQPAQKWLKDRKGRILDDDDLEHYQKIIVVLNETIKVMDKIEEVWKE
jgi:predicted helicase